MITVKTKKDIEILREGGGRLAGIFREIEKFIKPGISTKDLDNIAYDLIKKAGGRPAFLNYKPEGAKRPFPASICASIDEEVVHGIPSARRMIKEGEIITIDIGLEYKKMFTDMAITFPVGRVDAMAEKLLRVTEQALIIGIAAAKAGNTTGDIGAAIRRYIESEKLTANKVLAGHGVGYAIHEDPFIPNYREKKDTPVLKPGMVVALEPMVNEGTEGVVFDDNDGYTVRTEDGKRSAHFEHTILITEKEPEILTKT